MVGISVQPVAQFTEPGPIGCRVKIFQRQNMPHQLAVLDALDNGFRRAPFAGFLMFENPFVAGGIGSREDPLDRADSRNRHGSRADKRGFHWSGFWLLRLSRQRGCDKHQGGDGGEGLKNNSMHVSVQKAAHSYNCPGKGGKLPGWRFEIVNDPFPTPSCPAFRGQRENPARPHVSGRVGAVDRRDAASPWPG